MKYLCDREMEDEVDNWIIHTISVSIKKKKKTALFVLFYYFTYSEQWCIISKIYIYCS